MRRGRPATTTTGGGGGAARAAPGPSCSARAWPAARGPPPWRSSGGSRAPPRPGRGGSDRPPAGGGEADPRSRASREAAREEERRAGLSGRSSLTASARPRDSLTPAYSSSSARTSALRKHLDGASTTYSTSSSAYGRFSSAEGLSRITKKEGPAAERLTSLRSKQTAAAPAAASSSSRPRGCVGLSNLGNTCFMNSILQCLANVPELASFLRKGDAPSEIPSSARLSRAFMELVKDMWGADFGTSVSPRAFLSKVRVWDRRWAGMQQHDSQEFLHSLLDGIQNECNRNRKKPEYKELQGKGTVEEQADEAWEYARQWNDSFIDDIFCGQLQSVITCKKCKHASHCFDPFLDLSLPLAKSLRGADLKGCLDEFTSEEALSSKDGYKCEKCKAVQPAIKKLCIYRYPPVLILHLKRFSSSGRFLSSYSKNDSAVKFDVANLDLTPHCAPEAVPSMAARARPVYELIGISQHSGTMGGGHYTAITRSADNGKWYDFNDSMVSPSQPSTPSKSAYVLFYRLKEWN